MDFWMQQMKKEGPHVEKAMPMRRIKPSIKDDFSVRFPYQQKFMLGDAFPRQYLTRREAQSIYYLMRHKTMKETAQLMGLSHRTIEYYLTHAKEKFGCNRKHQLLERIKLTPLHAMFDAHSVTH